VIHLKLTVRVVRHRPDITTPHRSPGKCTNYLRVNTSRDASRYIFSRATPSIGEKPAPLLGFSF
jgi:hypothetical protein